MNFESDNKKNGNKKGNNKIVNNKIEENSKNTSKKILDVKSQEKSSKKDSYYNTTSEEEIYDLADLYKIFSDSTRLRILCVLCDEELCVNDIADMINMSQSAISHQLRVLKQSKLIKLRKNGKNSFYSIADAHIMTIIGNGLEHIRE